MTLFLFHAIRFHSLNIVRDCCSGRPTNHISESFENRQNVWQFHFIFPIYNIQKYIVTELIPRNLIHNINFWNFSIYNTVSLKVNSNRDLNFQIKIVNRTLMCKTLFNSFLSLKNTFFFLLDILNKYHNYLITSNDLVI